MKLSNKYLLLLCIVLITAFAGMAQNNNSVDEVEESAIVQGDTITVKSKVMNIGIKNTVIVPAQYFDEEMQEEQYPVVYLLHGYAGDYSAWSKIKPTLDLLATDYGFIIVCPDGKDSWYWDSPVDKKSQYETYITKELVPYIDSHYRTMPSPRMRAITGLSMGGHGALWLAMRHTDIFSVAGSTSGGVDITPFPEKWRIKEKLGSYADNKEVWEKHTVINLVPTLKKDALKIIFDCGTSDFFFPVNEKLHKALLEKGIDHDFIARPGSHNWPYWNNSIDYQMLFFQKAFEANSDK